MKALLNRPLCSVETHEKVGRNLRIVSLSLFVLTLACIALGGTLALCGVDIPESFPVIVFPLTGAISATLSLLFRWRLLAVLLLALNLVLSILFIPTLKPAKKRPNHPAAGKAEIVRLSRVEPHSSGLPEPCRSA